MYEDHECCWPDPCWRCDVQRELKCSMEGDWHRDWPMVKIAFWAYGDGMIWKSVDRGF